MTNHHSRLRNLERLSAIAKRNTKNLAAKLESDRLAKEVAALTDEELNARYQAVQAELANLPTDPAIINLSIQELITRYTEKLKES